ncbi:9558_t:CDS:10, partial [Cetraspora pellucida]
VKRRANIPYYETHSILFSSNNTNSKECALFASKYFKMENVEGRYEIENYDLVEGRYETVNNDLVEGWYEIVNKYLVEERYEAEDNNLVEEEQYEIENNNLDSEERENIPIGPILGSELEGLDPTHYPLITSSIELSVGTRFSSWEIAEYYLKEYGRQNGFATKRYRVELHKNRRVKKRTLACEKAGKYKPNKSKPIGQQRNKGSKRTDCKWHINLSSPEYTHYVHITFVYLEHNHSINADNKRFATAFRRFDESIMAEIEHAVVYGQCDAHMIRNLLQPKFPDQLFLTQDLSNAIQKIKRDKKVNGSDASYLLKFLLNQQKEEPTMFVQPLINVDKFINEFWKARNSLSVNVFEQQFQALIEKYPNAQDYLHNTLYSTRQSWACAFVNRIFTAGMQSTQRVESINALIHKEVSSSSSMTDVVEAIDSRMQREALNASFITWKYKSLVYHQPFIIERLFGNIEELIQKHLSCRIIEELKNQMCESVLYQCKKIEIDSAIEFNEDQLEQIVNREEHSDESNESEMDIDKDEAVEDYYDFRQTWFQNDSWEHLDLISKEPFIGVSSLKVQDKSIQQIVPKHFNNVQEIVVQHHVQKKVEYGRLMGNFKKALNYSMEDNDQKNLNELILSYISRKEKKREANAQSVIIEDQASNNNNIVKLVDGRIYNADDVQDPIAHQGKGRPATKRLKGFTEENSKAASNTKHANSGNEEKGIEVS